MSQAWAQTWKWGANSRKFLKADGKVKEHQGPVVQN